MPRLMLLLTLITASSAGCAGRARMPDPPAVERCLTLPDHFRCRRPDGTHYSDPYPGRVARIAMPVSDAEAMANFEAVER